MPDPARCIQQLLLVTFGVEVGGISSWHCRGQRRRAARCVFFRRTCKVSAYLWWLVAFALDRPSSSLHRAARHLPNQPTLGLDQPSSLSVPFLLSRPAQRT